MCVIDEILLFPNVMELHTRVIMECNVQNRTGLKYDCKVV